MSESDTLAATQAIANRRSAEATRAVEHEVDSIDRLAAEVKGLAVVVKGLAGVVNDLCDRLDKLVPISKEPGE